MNLNLRVHQEKGGRSPRLLTRMLVMSLAIQLALGGQLVLLAQTMPERQPPAVDLQDVAALKAEMKGALDIGEAIVYAFDLDKSLLDSVAFARTQLDALDDKALAEAGYMIAPLISRMSEINLTMVALIEASQEESPGPGLGSKSAGFPELQFPDEIIWDFDFSSWASWLNPLNIPSTFGSYPSDTTGGGVCKVLDSVPAILWMALMNLELAAEALKDVAEQVCTQNIAGFSLGLICIVTDVLFFIAKALKENNTFCGDVASDARATASWEGIKHIHGDLETVEAQLATHDADIKALLGNIQGAVDENQRLIKMFMSRQLEIMRLLITPAGRRNINEDVLTCTGDDCPEYPDAQLCRNGSLRWNCKR